MANAPASEWPLQNGCSLSNCPKLPIYSKGDNLGNHLCWQFLESRIFGDLYLKVCTMTSLSKIGGFYFILFSLISVPPSCQGRDPSQLRKALKKRSAEPCGVFLSQFPLVTWFLAKQSQLVWESLNFGGGGINDSDPKCKLTMAHSTSSWTSAFDPWSKMQRTV